ncbi:DNA repair protein RecN [Roseospirillum parvum]|uniref:DNA repair protein RecN n=1 Tax=Roseospirillum parvum TaxID=83401 RepID=A0A1G7UAR0_9PROT|nr:DNA repair protein RecN [Roseospirillum parvum]SDG44448.1 DNA repair protein RecN (Recombination protein N) [Roseospirillum parvum]
MLVSLSIRDVVLIDRLDLEVPAGLAVFTGETGAGKSILLDSLSLALGARADSSLVRPGAERLTVAARFEPPPGHAALALLAEHDIEPEEDGALILRRTLSAEGRSKATVNDQPASVGLLRQLGDCLVEIHGQFESHGLLDPRTHRPLLDSFAGLAQPLAATRAAHAGWRTAAKARAAAEAELKAARAEEDTLRHHLAELEALAPAPGEEGTLAEARTRMMHGERLLEGMNAALAALKGSDDGPETALATATRHLERVAPQAAGRLDGVIGGLERASVELAEALAALEAAAADIDLDPSHLESVEERLFALRALARKHHVEVDDLADRLADIRRRLDALEDGGADLARLAKAEQAARQDYVAAARALSKARTQAAANLDRRIATELPPLKLDKARFRTALTELPEAEWSAEGVDGIAFEVATNPGRDPGPLNKVASGGELARLMLALKVVLAADGTAPTLIFDEVDSGIGGATAAAVGERLARLGETLQVLVVTHSPQVAAKGAHHWRVAKRPAAKGKAELTTVVEPLDAAARAEEVARMLAADTVTEEARAAARRLLEPTR